MTRTVYFAYGSNMDVVQMGRRCPSSEYVGLGRLANHRFIINARGVATVIPDATGHVEGVLWHLANDDELTLDEYEGVPTYYQRQQASVETNSAEIQALIYIANESTVGPPRSGYMERIVAAAKQHGVGPIYLAELKQWINVPSS
jgi:gamma-glutamylcyclotransferase (GGCT)/AIG2-like uncharacterized protein YtfP